MNDTVLLFDTVNIKKKYKAMIYAIIIKDKIVSSSHCFSINARDTSVTPDLTPQAVPAAPIALQSLLIFIVLFIIIKLL